MHTPHLIASGRKTPRKRKPVYILAKGKRGCPPTTPPPQESGSFPALSTVRVVREIEFIVTLWVTYRELRLSLKKITRILQSNWKSDWKKHHIAEIKYQRSKEEALCMFYSIPREYILQDCCPFSKAYHSFQVSYLPDSHWTQFMPTQFENSLAEPA